MAELRDTDEIVVRPVLELAIYADSNNRSVVVLHVTTDDHDGFYQMTATDLLAFGDRIDRFALDAGLMGRA